MVSALNRRPPAGGDGRGLQPHHRRRSDRHATTWTGSCPATTTGSTPPARCRPRPAAPNTATEHAMMGKLMVDSVVTWATEYKVDGFRFDLMGHQPKALMVQLRAALDQLTLRRDGVDGKTIYLYGEGWNFGEVANDALFVQATQANMAGTGIGTFNDRIRDAVRGGGPFDTDPRIQGFAQRATTPTRTATRSTAPPMRRRPTLAARAGSGQGRPDRQPRGLPVRRRDRAIGDRRRGRLQRPAGRLHRRPAGGDQLRRGARQPDPVRRADREAAGGDVDGRPDPDADPGPATAAFSPGRVRSGRRVATSCAASPSTATATTPATGSTCSTRRYTTNGFGRGLPPAASNSALWPYVQPLLANPALKPCAGGPPDGAEADSETLLRIRASTPAVPPRHRRPDRSRS